MSTGSKRVVSWDANPSKHLLWSYGPGLPASDLDRLTFHLYHLVSNESSMSGHFSPAPRP